MASLPHDVVQITRKLPAIKTWLCGRGAEMLSPTNEWEVLRFRCDEGVGIVYKNKRNALTYNSAARHAVEAFYNGKTWNGALHVNRRNVTVRARTILERDGGMCFYCGLPIDEDFTIEHLIARIHGGPNHISNLYASHNACNKQAGTRSASEKIALRDQMRTQTRKENAK